MAGVLNFTLGLANSGFLGPLGTAQGGLTRLLGTGAAVAGMLGTLTGLGAGFAGVMHEINEGGRLFDLSKRTTESVASLYQLEHAFNDVGVGAQSVGTLVGQVQKALGGFNEMGEPTKDVFAAIGLSVDQLKRLNSPQVILAIGEALARLPKDEAMNIAAKIAGRGGAGDLLQIARSVDDFRSAMEKAAPQAAIMARNAAAFDRVGDTLGEIRLKARGLFAGIAEGAAPAIQSVLDKLNSIDLTGFGVRIGEAITVGTQALRDEQFTQLFSLSMKAGMQEANFFMQDLIAGWGEKLKKIFADADPNAAQGNQAPWADRFMAGLHGGAGLFMAGTLGALIPAYRDDVLDKSIPSLEQVGWGRWLLGLSDAAAGPQAQSRENVFAAELKKLYADLLARAPKPAGAELPNINAPKALSVLSQGLDVKLPVNSLEKIGLLISGGSGSNPAIDYQRRTANATEQARKTMEKVLSVVQQGLRVVGMDFKAA
jgi:hypothetical protein